MTEAARDGSPGASAGGALRLPPDDEHNRHLVENVHPHGWSNPEPDGAYNLVAVGAGAAGLVSCAGAAGLGAKVALIERHLLGGDCLNVGCVPSKALIRAARAAADVRRAGAFGVRVPGGVTVDFPAVMERMRRLRAQISHHDAAARFRDLGIDVFLGAGRFTGPDTVEVAGKTLRFKRAVIATGGRPITLPIPGLAETGFLNNVTVFELTELPRRIAVIGAGPIGCELAQSFRRFGAEVTLLEVAPKILIREDGDAAAVIHAALAREGIGIITGATTSGVSRRGAEKVLSVEVGGEAREVLVDEIIVGVGRAPNVEGLGLEEAGVAYDKRLGVTVDERLRTTNKRIFAAGDICFPYKFTHTADAMARIVIRNALFAGRAKTTALTIPWATYTDPEIAHVGLYPREAEERGIAIDTFTTPLSGVDRAILEGETEGFCKVHVRKGTDEILGATIVGPHAGDLISEITVCMTGGLGLGHIANTIHPYPTVAEAIKKTGDAYNRTRLTPTVAKWMKRWLRWRR
jgi:pyruvate/2-oxoglutarate dehydrogenase complex dihydrolipoamide dehydrogenase (E3) component